MVVLSGPNGGEGADDGNGPGEAPEGTSEVEAGVDEAWSRRGMADPAPSGEAIEQ